MTRRLIRIPFVLTNLVSLATLLAPTVWAQVNAADPQPATRPMAANAHAPRQWRVLELTFAVTRAPAAPPSAVEFTATFTGPEARKFIVPGFFDGEGTWKIRFTPTVPGHWSWQTKATVKEGQSNDSGLESQQGRFTALPADPKDANALYAHGGLLAVAPTGRYLTYADGTPFFWLGDTCWWCPSELTPLDKVTHAGTPPFYKAWIDTRARQGYTVVQLGFLSGNGQVNGAEKWIRNRLSAKPDVAFWHDVDRQIAYANDAGIVPVLGVGFSAALDRYSVEDWQGLWRDLVARYGAYSVTWLICGEYNDPPNGDQGRRVPKVLALGQYIKELDPYKRAMTVHPGWHGGDKHQAWSMPWYDFTMIQGAHGTNTPLKVYADAWNHRPARPLLEAECNYEGIRPPMFKGVPATVDLSTSDVRWAAYRAIQNGSFGYTYGAHGLWYPVQGPDDRTFAKAWGVAKPWWEALTFPGGAQMQHLRAIYESVQWWKLQPRPGVITDELALPEKINKAWEAPRGEQALVKADGTATFTVYFLDGLDRQATAVLPGVKPNATYTATWFDPRTGRSQPAILKSADTQGRLTLPDRPDGQDWMLIARLAEH